MGKPRRQLNTKIAKEIFDPNYFDLVTIGGWTHSTLYYALVIHYHPTVNADIFSARTDLKFDLMGYERSNLDSLYGLEYKLSSEKRKQLLEIVEKLLEKYYLDETWGISLKIKILTNILVVPYDSGKIVYHKPINEKKIKSAPKNLLNLSESVSLPEIMAYIGRKKYPAIHITERFNSKSELIDWINLNWKDTIKPSMENLPNRLWTKAALEDLMLGLWLRNLKFTKTWSEVETLIDTYEKKDWDFFGDEKNRITLDRTKGADLVNRANGVLREFFPM